MTIWNTAWKVFLALSLAAGLAGSLGCEGAPSAASNSASVGGNGDGSDPTPSADYFYVHGVGATGIKTYTHLKDGAWTDKCKVDLDAATAAERDIFCVVEVEEKDAYLNELKLVYNMPRHEECKYVDRMGYYAYTHQPGIGPSAITYRDVEGTLSLLTVTDAGADGGTITLDSSGALKCSFNHLPDGPNCCQGDYVATVSQYNAQTTTYDTVTVNGNWGGKISNCIKGPAVDNQELATDGYPRWVSELLIEGGQTASALHTTSALVRSSLAQLTFAQISIAKHSTSQISPSDFLVPKTHLKHATFEPFAEDDPAEEPTDDDPYTGEFVISSPADKSNASNLYVANYYEDINTLPKAVSGASSSAYASPYYYYQCVNEAGEIHAQIRMMVREWNTVSEFKKLSNTADANVTGNEPYFPDSYNDRRDWKDITDIGGQNTFPQNYW